MKHNSEKPSAGPHGGPGGASTDSLSGAAVVEAGAGPHGGPGSLSPADEPELEDEVEES
jgi:hypothetical protein